MQRARFGLLALLAACATSGATSEPAFTTAAAPAARIEGTYHYLANLPGQQIRGKMRIYGDTITVEPMADYCRPTVRASDPLAFHYSCNGAGSFESIQLVIDRRNPVQLSKWSANYRVRKTRSVCIRYEVRAGENVCVRSQQETYDSNESKSGTLQIRRVP
jgi:hypothetical protein